jgi:hypothetical protein
MPEPTFVQEAETVWNTTTPKSTASFSVLAGDVLIAWGMIENHFPSLSIAGGSLTWTQQQLVDVVDYCLTSIWTAIVDSDKSMTVTFTRSGGAGSELFGGNVLTFRDSDGIGASNKTNVSSGAPSLSLTTTQANSAIVVANGDWNAGDGSSRTWRTANSITPTSGNGLERTYFRDAARCTVYGAYYSDAGTSGAKTIGLSAPSGQKYAIAAVEVLGTAAGGSAYELDAEPGVFTLSGQSIALRAARKLSANNASYTLAGQTVALRAGRKLAANHATYSLAGQSSALRIARKLALTHGVYTLSGQDVDLLYEKAQAILAAEVGVFTFAGQDAQLRVARRLLATHGAYTLSGQNLQLRASRRLNAAHGTYALTGQAISLRRAAILRVLHGLFTLTGHPVELLYSGELSLQELDLGIARMSNELHQLAELVRTIEHTARLTHAIELRST